MDCTRLYLCRHASTPGNERTPRILQGSSIDDSLSKQGSKQAGSLAEFFSHRNIAAVYSSKLTRARQTAELVADKHQLSVSYLSSLNEVDVGQWAGLTWSEIKHQYPAEFVSFERSPDKVGYPKGESFEEVLERSLPMVETLFDKHQGENIVVISHSIVNRVLLAHILGIDLIRARKLVQKNCCINLLQKQNGKVEVLTLNSYFHLW